MQRPRIVQTMQIVIGATAAAGLLAFGLSASRTNRENPPATAPSEPATQPAPVIEKVTISGEQFKLELAATEPTRARGLMERTSISPTGGMLFVHRYPQELGYWMVNCLIDIDIMFLDTRGRIVATHTMKVEPPRREDETQAQYESRLPNYPSGVPALFVIELKAGTIKRLKLKPGMEISLDLERLKKLAK